VVLKDGLAIGICGREPADAIVRLKITADAAVQTPRFNTSCGTDIIPEPLHKGEILRVLQVFPDFERSLLVQAESLSPHAVTRGIGANQHESQEIGKTELQFMMPEKHDYEGAARIADTWIKSFDTLEEAAVFGKSLGNTASGAFVKEVRLGMTLAEVESVMGVPVAKADLGQKVLYKYKDMTVEFHDGKVADVR
jgi:hypothetical protein